MIIFVRRSGIFLIIVALIAGLTSCARPAQYSLYVSTTEGGEITAPGEGTFSYEKGTEVPLVAFPHTGYRFVNWSGDVDDIADVDAASTSITVRDNYEITANFGEIPRYDLSISSTSGGSVTAPGEGTSTYDDGTLVNLVAMPDAGYCFGEWTGNVSAVVDVYDASSTIIMNNHYSIIANFLRVEFADGLRTIYLDSGVIRVGVDKDWGGAIREIWYNDENLVNNFDSGRLIGVSLYDGGDTYGLDCGDASWGWNPVASDKYSHLNPPLTYSFENGILYVKARNLEWNPDNKGGGPERLVASDVVVETWIKFLSKDGSIIALTYKVTHEGLDSHVLAGQELPYVYIRTILPHFVSYTGNVPWTDDAVILADPPTFPDFGTTAATENWAGFVNSQNKGLVLWTPQSNLSFTYVFHNIGPPPDNATYYMAPSNFLEIGPGFSVQYQAYLFVGPWQDARQSIYNLHQALVFSDIQPCFGVVDIPVTNAMVSGDIQVEGWAIDNLMVDTVEIFLDGLQIGQATYGWPRPDVDTAFPGFPGSPDFGFSYSLDTRKHANGTHVLEVRATDASDNTSYLAPGRVVVDIQNQ